MLTIGGDDASMVTRGLFVLHDLLRGTVKDPPPGTDTTPVHQARLSPSARRRDRIKSKSVWRLPPEFEPLAFGLEKFDGRRAFSDQDEHGNPLRDDGVVLYPGEPEPVSYQDRRPN